MLRKQLIAVSLASIIIFASAVPAFAQSTADVSTSTTINSSENGWVFGEDNRIEDFFDGIFGRKFEATLDGAQEVPGPGDIDGTGEAKVKIKESKSQLCVDIETDYIDQPSAAHIHHAPKGSAGAVVVPFSVPNGNGRLHECVEVDHGLLKAIKENPQDYYVNIHTNPYPNGAIRGQLSK